jgi:gas vesicle protein
LKNKEDSFSETTRKMMIEIEKENRVHDEVWRFLEDSLEDYQQGIETWMEKYDNDMDEHEQAVQTIQVET